MAAPGLAGVVVLFNVDHLVRDRGGKSGDLPRHSYVIDKFDSIF